TACRKPVRSRLCVGFEVSIESTSGSRVCYARIRDRMPGPVESCPSWQGRVIVAPQPLSVGVAQGRPFDLVLGSAKGRQRGRDWPLSVRICFSRVDKPYPETPLGTLGDPAKPNGN